MEATRGRRLSIISCLCSLRDADFVEPLFLVYGSIQMKIVDLARPIKRKHVIREGVKRVRIATNSSNRSAFISIGRSL